MTGPQLSIDEMARAIARATGLDADRARQEALRQHGVTAAAPARSVADVLALPSPAWPFKLLIPWSYLASDNTRHGAIASLKDGKPFAQLILTKQYRAAKNNIADLAKRTVGEVEPAHIPLQLEARVWVPDDIRAHDVCNFAKVTHDALEGVIYTKDRWLFKTTWERAGVDVDAPRALVRIQPYVGQPPDADREGSGSCG